MPEPETRIIVLDRPEDAPGRSRASPLWAVLSLAFAGSVGTAVVTNGVFFLAESAYGFAAPLARRTAALQVVLTAMTLGRGR